jgi:PTS system mannose-specific IIC component
MLPGPGTLALLAVIGGAAALDGTSLGQLMVSRPIVAATLAGWAAGAPAQGALLGLFMEAMHLSVLPVGAARYPEGGPPAVAGAALFAGTAGTYADLLPIVLFCMVGEWVSGATVGWLRHANSRLAAPPGTTELDPATLERRHVSAIALDFARGAVLTLVGLVLLALWLRVSPSRWVDERLARLVLGGLAAASIASSLRLFGRRRLPWFVAGAAAGAVVVALG